MSGPSIVLTPNALQHLGMAFHELGANSAKYGVLSGAQGTIAVSWELVDREGFKLTWTERDGPEVQKIGKGDGFGSIVLKRVTPQAVGGTGDLAFGPRGVTWTLEAPLANVDASSSNQEC